MEQHIRQVLREHAHLQADVDTLTDSASLYDAGMTSHASVGVMLALEDAFAVEFPDRMLRRSVFESVASIRGALEELLAATSDAMDDGLLRAAPRVS